MPARNPKKKIAPRKKRPPAKSPASQRSAKKARTSTSRSRKSTSDLNVLREKIDDVDRRLVKLLNQRAKLVVQVGEAKRGSGVPVYAPHREAEVLNKVLGLSDGPLPDRTVEAIYRELMSGSFRLEQPLRIGFLGPEGSYSHVAASRHFGSSVEYEDLRAIEGVFTEVARGHVDYGLVPIENTTGGGIVETMDAFKRYHGEVNIYAEAQLEVHHCLLASCSPNEVRRIHSKPEVFAQCRKWLATQYPQAELVPAASSARAVQTAKAEYEIDPNCGSAAIGSELAGELHGMHPIFTNIEDETSNITRFLILSKQSAERSRDDKTSIMFTTADKPGALVEVLAVFQRAGINLTHIDKRPSGRVNWQYTFFVDAVGHVDDPWFAAALKQAAGHCQELTVLGSYPRSQRIL